MGCRSSRNERKYTAAKGKVHPYPETDNKGYVEAARLIQRVYELMLNTNTQDGYNETKKKRALLIVMKFWLVLLRSRKQLPYIPVILLIIYRFSFVQLHIPFLFLLTELNIRKKR